ncbi:hypothetical protein N784_08865 [Pontibacillus litoralis JSM 072002]|uniref:Uncharacterized protein n=1 Tax=Pontibacillus litoralis JSM 072002 TaxID=1385512 RepID=A0A0A5G0G4_9BACI|nr:hypothetical protein N784_08865 [Pontibacillus litoralis JSM 072002]
MSHGVSLHKLKHRYRYQRKVVYNTVTLSFYGKSVIGGIKTGKKAGIGSKLVGRQGKNTSKWVHFSGCNQ